jgi:hypothetical protein
MFCYSNIWLAIPPPLVFKFINNPFKLLLWKLKSWLITYNYYTLVEKGKVASQNLNFHSSNFIINENSKSILSCKISFQVWLAWYNRNIVESGVKHSNTLFKSIWSLAAMMDTDSGFLASIIHPASHSVPV